MLCGVALRTNVSMCFAHTMIDCNFRLMRHRPWPGRKESSGAQLISRVNGGVVVAPAHSLVDVSDACVCVRVTTTLSGIIASLIVFGISDCILRFFPFILLPLNKRTRRREKYRVFGRTDLDWRSMIASHIYVPLRINH